MKLALPFVFCFLFWCCFGVWCCRKVALSSRSHDCSCHLAGRGFVVVVSWPRLFPPAQLSERSSVEEKGAREYVLKALAAKVPPGASTHPSLSPVFWNAPFNTLK